MTLPEQLQQCLVTLVSAVAGRCYPMTLPEGVELPALTYQRISDPREYSHSGRSELEHPRYQVTCWAATYGVAVALASEVREAVETLGKVQVEVQPDQYDPTSDTYMIPVDAIIWTQ